MTNPTITITITPASALALLEVRDSAENWFEQEPAPAGIVYQSPPPVVRLRWFRDHKPTGLVLILNDDGAFTAMVENPWGI